jgi:hypothetical protein
LPFGEDNYVARPESAAVMHCSRSCEQVECPASYECKKDLVVTGATSKGIKGSVSLWCGKTVRTEPTPLQEIPLITIARYFAAGLAVPAIVSLHREGAELVVISPKRALCSPGREGTAASPSLQNPGPSSST